MSNCKEIYSVVTHNFVTSLYHLNFLYGICQYFQHGQYCTCVHTYVIMYMYIHSYRVHSYICTCVHIHCMYTHPPIHMYIYMYYIYSCKHTKVHIHTYIHLSIHTYICTYICTYITCMYACKHTIILMLFFSFTAVTK